MIIDDIKKFTAVPPEYRRGRAFYDGDHFQNLEGWGGVLPDPRDDTYAVMAEQISNAFRSHNSIAEVVRNQLAPILGKNLKWHITVERPLLPDESPTDEEQALIDEAVTAISHWWRQKRVNRVLHEAGVTLCLCKRAPYRIFVPPRFVGVDGRLPRVSQLDEALNFINVHSPSPEFCGVKPYPTLASQDVGVYKSKNVDGMDTTEVTYLSEDGRTVVKVDNNEISLPLDNRLLMHEMSVPYLFVNRQILSLQVMENFAITMGQKNLMHGYFEWFLINTEMPSEVQQDPITGQEVEVVKPLKTGPGRLTNLVGIQTQKESASGGFETNYLSPDVKRFEPIGVDVYLNTQQWCYQMILASCQQLYFMISGDAVTSGESRKQALTSFLQSLSFFIEEYGLAVEWMLSTVLRLCGVFMGQPNRYNGLRVSVTIRPDTGPLLTEELKTIVEQWQVGFISHRTALARTGFDRDAIEAELNEVAMEREQRQTDEQAALAAAVIQAQQGGSVFEEDEPPVDEVE